RNVAADRLDAGKHASPRLFESEQYIPASLEWLRLFTICEPAGLRVLKCRPRGYTGDRKNHTTKEVKCHEQRDSLVTNQRPDVTPQRHGSPVWRYLRSAGPVADRGRGRRGLPAAGRVPDRQRVGD